MSKELIAFADPGYSLPTISQTTIELFEYLRKSRHAVTFDVIIIFFVLLFDTTVHHLMQNQFNRN
jgi:chromate transport protein ChrA